MEVSLSKNDSNGSTDPVKSIFDLKLPKVHKSDSETESDSEDAIFNGVSKDSAEELRSQIAKIKVGFSVQVEQQGREELQRVKEKFRIFCNPTDLTDEEVEFSLAFCKRHNMNTEDMIEREGLSFLHLMREMMKCEPEAEQSREIQSGKSALSIEEEKDAKNKDENYEPNKVIKKRRRKARAAVKNEDGVKPVKRTGYNLDGSKRVKRILLDDALKDKDTKMNEWSEARKKAYKAIKQNPNTYHYRFNKPGEAQAKGAWTTDEHKRFMELLLEKGANKNWGLFSMHIKGRVGYQCSNYYRLLVKNIKIWDPNYWYDGKLLHFKRNCERSDAWMKFAFTVLEDTSGVFGEPPAQHPKRPTELASPEEVARIALEGFPDEPPEGFKSKSKDSKRKSKKRKAPVKWTRKAVQEPEDDDADLDVYFAALAAVPAKTESDIVFPRFIDPFTKCEITTPAISPYGHVCEYDTWTKVLRTPGVIDTCPFTRKHVTRRQLVKLTKENIDEFEDKIINQERAISEWRQTRKEN